jgi:hypothetical protein
LKSTGVTNVAMNILFPDIVARYDDILKIAEIRTGRCSELPTSSRIFKNYILIISYNLEHVR